jgi:hypothetical protein
MGDLITTICVAIITNGAVLGLFVWVFKKLFETALSKRTEAFKSEIELINKKNYYQFSKLYDEQAQNVKEVYSDLVYMLDQTGYLVYHYNLLEEHPEFFEQYMRPKDSNPIKWDRYLKTSLSEKQEDVKAQEIKEHASKSLAEFRRKRIFFHKNVADEIERYINLILFVSSQFKNVTYRDPEDFQPVVADEVIKTWVKAVDASHQLFPILEETFRSHLGISDEIASSNNL